MEKLKLLSLFSGIGAFEQALDNNGNEYELINYCEFDNRVADAYSIIHNEPIEKNLGDVRTVNPEELEDFNLMTYGFPCFTGETLVLTDKGYKEIQDIRVGDKVLTHNRRYQKVTHVFNQGVKSIYHVVSKAFEDTYTTENHPFYVREMVDGQLQEPKWVEAKDLTIHSHVGVAINQEDGELSFGLGLNGEELVEHLQEELDCRWQINPYKKGFHVTSHSRKAVLSLGHKLVKAYKKPYGIKANEDSSTYTLYFNTKSLNKEVIYKDGFLWYPVEAVREDVFEEEVYDITVENDHSFTANGIVVHNCQDISTLGLQKGFFHEDGTPTRSGLFFEAMRIARVKKPEIMIAENVRALTFKKNADDFQSMLNLLSEIGYNSYYHVMNAKDFGVPHSRMRVFIVSIRADIDKGTFTFPEPVPLTKSALDYIDYGQTSVEYYLNDYQKSVYLKPEKLKRGFCSLDAEVSICQNTKQGHPSNSQNFVTDVGGVRVYTPMELFALQGFDKEQAEMLKNFGFTNTKLGHMSGNSIAVPVLEHLFRRIFNSVDIPNVTINQLKVKK